MTIDEKIQALRDAQAKLVAAHERGSGIVLSQATHDALARDHVAALIEEIVNLREANNRLQSRVGLLEKGQLRDVNRQLVAEIDSKDRRISALYERLYQYEDCVGLLK